MKTITRRPASLALLAAALVGTACSKDTDASATNVAPVSQNIGPGNIAVARTDTLRSGPAISGTLIADREARIRAEMSGAVLQTYAEAGEPVREGTVLARLDDSNVRGAVLSARSAVTQITVAAEQAARELQRAKTLAAAGAIAERDVESATNANLGTQAALADAKSRLESAEKSLRNATIRAPFAGIVAERAVSPGDVVSPGSALFTVIDPRSLKLEASVPTTALADVRVGAPVLFTVNGSDRVLEGRVTRVSPMVDPQTKQVRLLASVPNSAGVLVAGLFVEGRVASQKRVGVLVPESAVDQTGIAPTLMRLKGGKVEKVEVQLGARDEAASMFEVTTGVASGDTVLLGAARGISVGSAVVVSAPRDAQPAAAPTAAPTAAPSPASTKKN